MAVSCPTNQLRKLLAPFAERAQRDLREFLVEPGTPWELAEAMEYCVLSGGKRLRPGLVYLTAEAVGANADDELTRRAAVAVELVHCYSLVHDDLPAMDDDSIRRGRPTAHIKFGQAMAILTGDALLTRAFSVLAGSEKLQASKLVQELATAAGPAGMIAGQAADMDLCEIPGGLEGLKFIHSRKTAAMICGAVRMGGICGNASPEKLTALGEYGLALGLAFQLTDDLLDVTASSSQLGKTAGKDAASGKRTHIGQMGLAQATDIGKALTDRAIEAIAPLGLATDSLASLAVLLAERKS